MSTTLSEFKIKAGATVRVLTTAANEVKTGRREKFEFHKEQKHFQEKDCFDKKFHDPAGIFTGVLLDVCNIKGRWGADSSCDCNEHHEKYWDKEDNSFLILSLNRASFPYASGEIIWIKREQIVAVAVVCDN
ncbi:hypothetical protein P22_1215 [Propionispora sp. 2/2-37]|uniref:hypothetical protein n=1 Tax=Propionispora sp. 2/2-37 TaxID=1677858 RepID=UPI0006BB886E|nr:hypothetical protein [Propionispora sp. 2/2-37]CUH95146.1 hypothetical protein P22_1215 [Propionispora sp. 2/2-37]